MDERVLRGILPVLAVVIFASAAAGAIMKSRKRKRTGQYLEEFCDGPCFISFSHEEKKSEPENSNGEV